MWGINFCYFNVGTNLDDETSTAATAVVRAFRVLAETSERSFSHSPSKVRGCESAEEIPVEHERRTRPAGNARSHAVINREQRMGCPDERSAIAMGPENDSATMRYCRSKGRAARTRVSISVYPSAGLFG